MPKLFNIRFWSLISAFLFFVEVRQLHSVVREADVVIYGGTAAAISAAVQVKRMGKSVILVCPESRLGGMTSNGLSLADRHKKESVGGIAREFYHRVWRYYQSPDVWKWQKSEDFGNRGQGNPTVDGELRTMWVFEPKVAVEIFESWIVEHEIEVFRNEWLDRFNGVEMLDQKITSITCLSGNIYQGKVFLDCSYEGDLMAACGISYVVGREGNDLYGETLNGVQVSKAQKNQFLNRIDPYVIAGKPQSGLLPRIGFWEQVKDGTGDQKIQTYNFRLCLTNAEENREPFPKPLTYDSKQYEVLLRTLNRGSRNTFVHFDPIPNAKVETKNHGSFSINNIGMNYAYPEGSYEERDVIIKEHENYLKGFFYFLTQDPSVPAEVRGVMENWGLARDEFTNSGNWPEQLFVREARRMLGQFVTTEKEISGFRKTRKSIGMGSYILDSSNVQRYVITDENENAYILNEGSFQIELKDPGQISYESIVPRREECANLLVPVCSSVSHVVSNSVRTEPSLMIAGQSAGLAAVLAVEKEISVQDISYSTLRKQLVEQGQVLGIDTLNRISRGEGVSTDSLGGVVVDGSTVELVGEWVESTSLRPFVGDSYFHDGNGGKGMRSAKFPFVAPKNGLHEIKVSFSSFGNRAGNLKYNVKHDGGLTKVLVDQRKPQPIDQLWFSLGSFNFSKGEQYHVSLNNENTEGYVVVDAIQVIGLSSTSDND